MAKLSAMPSKEIIDAFRGIVDFYMWCDLPIARKWPSAPTRARSLPSRISGSYFAYINRTAANVDHDTKQALDDMATHTKMTWKDWMISLYLSGAKYITTT